MLGISNQPKPCLVVVTTHPVAAHLRFGKHFHCWDVRYMEEPQCAGLPRVPALVLVDADSFAPEVRTDELILDVRRELPAARAVLIATVFTPRVVNRAQVSRVELVAQSDAADNLRLLAELEQWQGDLVVRLVNHLAWQHGLSSRESEVVELSVRGLRQAHIAARLGVSVNTVKTLSRRALRKAGASRLSELACRTGHLGGRLPPEE